MEEEQRLLEVQDHVNALADSMDGISPGEAVSILQFVQMVTKDVMWLIERVRHHEHEKNVYKEQVELLLDNKNLNA